MIDGDGRVRDARFNSDRVIVPVSGGNRTPFTLVRGTDFLANGRQISLAAYQDGMPGPIFRSGRLQTLPAGAPGNRDALVSVILIGQQRFPIADINAMIPTPITLPDGNVVTTATVSSAPPSRTLTLVATGPRGTGTFTYTLNFTIDPSDDQYDLASVLTTNAVGRGSIVFTAGPGGGLEAFISNLFVGLFEAKITMGVMVEIIKILNNLAAAEGAKAAAAAGASGGLPANVVLGVRSVDVASNGDIVMSPAIGSFGSIIDKFVNASPPGGSRCFVATAALGSDAIEVATLRAFRDDLLLPTRAGRIIVAVYERLSPPFAALIARSLTLRAIARKLVIYPAYLIAKRSLARRATGRAKAARW